MPELQVKVVALHLGCEACGETALVPIGALSLDEVPGQGVPLLDGWWGSHQLPVIAGWDVVVNGKFAHWERVSG